MMLYDESGYLSITKQLAIGIHQRFCRHHWCGHFHIIHWGVGCAGNLGFQQKFCPKCGKVESA
ncbi:hypothetical protein ACNVFB_004650, partial [Yersinia enterocolitica]